MKNKRKNRTLFLHFLTAVFLLSSVSLISCKDTSREFPIQITVDKTTVGMGYSVKVEAAFKNIPSGEELMFLPFVNGKRWGSHEFADKDGQASFIIPLPNPGPALIQVIAVPVETDTWLGLETQDRRLKAGTFMPECENKSNTLLVEVQYRDVIRKTSGETLFGVQWEPWFIPGFSWETAQGSPVMGIYDSTDPDVLRQQILWFMDLGVVAKPDNPAS